MEIEKILITDTAEILDIADKIFPETIGFNYGYIGSYLNKKQVQDISVKLVDNEKIIGFYIMNSASCPSLVKEARIYGIDPMKGIEGIALGIIPEYRGTGLGKRLIMYPYAMTDFDYIWGKHFTHLNNMKEWAKRRVVIDEGSIFLSITALRHTNMGTMPMFKHYQQTEGWNCGPTALLIAYKPMLNYKSTTIDEISSLCGADNITGTTDVRMKAGLDALDIKYLQSSELNNKNALHWLKYHLNESDVFLLRGLVKGVKHWVVVTNYDKRNKVFRILDPWLGDYELDGTGLLEIWQPRNFDGFILFKENYI
jgi:hypothetical protein